MGSIVGRHSVAAPLVKFRAAAATEGRPYSTFRSSRAIRVFGLWLFD